MKHLSEAVYYMKFEAPDIAKNRKAGQFLIVMVDQDLNERIPLTIADANAEEGWVAIAFQPIGASTMKLAQLKAGDYLGGVLGPLWNQGHRQSQEFSVQIHRRPCQVDQNGTTIQTQHLLQQTIQHNLGARID